MLTKIDIEKLSLNSDKILYEYQKENKKKIYTEWMKCQSVMLQMPTGTGKTKLFVSIVNDFYNYRKGKQNTLKILVLAHRKELVLQMI